MKIREVIPGVYRLALPAVSTFLCERNGQVTIVDASIPRKEDEILDAVQEIGRSPEDVKHILVTHYHGDHIGSLGPLAEKTGATVFAPAGEAAHIRDGGRAPEMKPRGLLGRTLKAFVKLSEMPPAPVHEEVRSGDVIPAVGSMEVISTPGHTTDHCAYLLKDPGVLFAGDAAWRLGRLQSPPVAEDVALAQQSFAALAKHDFEVACFGHGAPLTKRASQRFAAVARRL